MTDRCHPWKAYGPALIQNRSHELTVVSGVSRANVRNDVSNHVRGLQCSKVVHLHHVLLPTTCSPLLDFRERCKLRHGDPEEARLLPNRPGCHSCSPEAQGPSIRESDNYGMSVTPSKSQHCFGSHQSQRCEGAALRP